MIVTDRKEAANWLTAAAAIIAVLMPVRMLFTELGWFGLAFGRLSSLFWAVVLAWAACVACVLAWERRWLVLITAPFVLYPVAMAGLLLAACATGDCV